MIRTFPTEAEPGDHPDPIPCEPFVVGQDDEYLSDIGRQDERARALNDAIEELPQRQRQCILLQLEGLSGNQIAERLGISQPAVSQTLTAARKNLAKNLTHLTRGRS